MTLRIPREPIPRSPSLKEARNHSDRDEIKRKRWKERHSLGGKIQISSYIDPGMTRLSRYGCHTSVDCFYVLKKYGNTIIWYRLGGTAFWSW